MGRDVKRCGHKKDEKTGAALGQEESGGHGRLEQIKTEKREARWVGNGSSSIQNRLSGQKYRRRDGRSKMGKKGSARRK